MAISFIGATQRTGGPDLTAVADVPTHVDGDLLFLVISCASGGNPGTPAGWTQVALNFDGSSSFANATAVFWRFAASEPASYNFSLGASNVRWSTVMLSYRGVAAIPVDVEGSAAGSSGTSYVAPSVDVTALGARLVGVFAKKSNSQTTPPSGMTERADAFDGDGSQNVAVELADETLSNVGLTGTRTATGTSAPWLAWVIALAPYNTPPNAPTLVSPAGGVSIDLAVTNRFSWTFSDPDPGDTQSKFDLRYRPAAGGAWTDITQTTPNNFYDLPASTLTAGDYEWQARTYDAQGVVGPYSSSGFFTAATVSNDITITAPTNGATISTETFTVTWSTPTQTDYQLRVVADLAGVPDTATVIYDTGEIASSSARSRQVSYPDNGVTRHTQVRKKQAGLWSDWASVSNPVSYTQPAVPSITVDDTSQPGAIQVQATHPTPTGSEPTVSYMDVWRRRAKVDADGNFVEWYDTERDPGGENGFPHRDGSQLAPTAIFTDWFVNGSGYSYRVRDVGSNGTSSYSEWSDDGSGEVVNEIDGGAPDTVYDDELDGGGP